MVLSVGACAGRGGGRKTRVWSPGRDEDRPPEEPEECPHVGELLRPQGELLASPRPVDEIVEEEDVGEQQRRRHGPLRRRPPPLRVRRVELPVCQAGAPLQEGGVPEVVEPQVRRHDLLPQSEPVPSPYRPRLQADTRDVGGCGVVGAETGSPAPAL